MADKENIPDFDTCITKQHTINDKIYNLITLEKFKMLLKTIKQT
jgi:hypothetical protein